MRLTAAKINKVVNVASGIIYGKENRSIRSQNGGKDYADFKVVTC